MFLVNGFFVQDIIWIFNDLYLTRYSRCSFSHQFNNSFLKAINCHHLTICWKKILYLKPVWWANIGRNGTRPSLPLGRIAKSLCTSKSNVKVNILKTQYRCGKLSLEERRQRYSLFSIIQCAIRMRERWGRKRRLIWRMTETLTREPEAWMKLYNRLVEHSTQK